MNVFSVSHQSLWLSLSTVTLLALGTSSWRLLLDFSHQLFWLCPPTVVTLFNKVHYFDYLDSNVPPMTRWFDVITLRLFGYFEQFLALLSHVSSNNSMMSLSTRCVRTRGMIFSLLFACGLILNYLKYSWRGVSTIRASISGWMAMCTSNSLHFLNSNNVWDFSLSIEVNSLCYNKHLALVLLSERMGHCEYIIWMMS